VHVDLTTFLIQVVMRGKPAEIRPNIDPFLSALSQVADGALVSADAFVAHHNADGTFDKTKTDVLLHFVDPGNHSVIEADDVLMLIDYRTEELDALFREYNVIEATQAESSSAVRSSRRSTNTAGMAPFGRDALVMWLAAACSFLLLLLVLAAVAHYRMRRKYLRKLRAAQAASAAEGEPARVAGVPNTNRHASEGSNPVWMTGAAYDNLGMSGEDRYRKQDDVDDDYPPDSLDANVLLTSGVGHHGDSGDDGYDEAYAGCAASTVRVASAGANGRVSGCSSSSGLGSGASRGQPRFTTAGGSISALFPPTMPPVDKLGVYGHTVYDEDDVPRTEL